VPLDAAERVAQRLLADPAVRPIGLGARDTLRLEAGLPLHGNELSPSVSPIEAGLAFAVARSRRKGGAKAGGFPGAARVLRELVEGAPRQLIGLVSDDGVPVRAHAVVVDAQDRQVGEVNSGTISPTLGKAVMLALVNRDALTTGAMFRAVVRDKRPLLERVALPFVPKRYRR